MICPYCGGETDGSVKFCHLCGHRIEQFAPKNPTCPQCSHPIMGTEKFCPFCGCTLGQASQDASADRTQNTNICSVCGGALEPGAKFCAGCGAPTGQSSASVTAEIPVDRTAVYNAPPAPAYQPAPVVYQMPVQQKKRGTGMAVTGIVLGAFALIGWFVVKFLPVSSFAFGLPTLVMMLAIIGFGLLLGFLGLIFSIIGIARGTGGTRIAGVVGLVACGAGMLLLSLALMDIVNLVLAYGAELVMEQIQNIDFGNLSDILKYFQYYN